MIKLQDLRTMAPCIHNRLFESVDKLRNEWPDLLFRVLVERLGGVGPNAEKEDYCDNENELVRSIATKKREAAPPAKLLHGSEPFVPLKTPTTERDPEATLERS